MVTELRVGSSASGADQRVLSTSASNVDCGLQRERTFLPSF